MARENIEFTRDLNIRLDADEFRSLLLAWFEENARDFPWRHPSNRTPYRAAIAELMLRRTRADQVVPVYERFLAAYPTLSTAAEAPPDEIRRLLYPLGLAWRADSVVTFLKEAYTRFGDEIPDEAETLRTLPGVGDYVGAAIAVFAGNHVETLIDVNVVRVLGRLSGLDYSGEARRRKPMRQLANRTVDPLHVADYHYAILDFAAKVCVAGIPRCKICPFQTGDRCVYYRSFFRDLPTLPMEPPKNSSIVT